MIITELYDGQGLGNQLWLYSACRSIADELGHTFSILNPQRFKGGNFLDIDLGQADLSKNDGKHGSHSLQNTGTSRVFYERLFYDPDLDYVSSGFDDSVRSLRSSTRIEGLFQSEKYFFGDVDRARKYIKIKPESLARNPVPRDRCILNIRGGEYKRHRRLILPQSYWLKAMRNMTEATGVDNFLIVTDDPRYAKALLPRIPVLEGGIAECYMAIYLAEYVILSNSSFAYFPVKTSCNKRFVIAPKYWARFNNIYSRWASPANLYQDWLWQDQQGVLYSYEECVDGQLATLNYYKYCYSIQVPSSFVNRTGFRAYIPGRLKKCMKRGLSLIFPKHFG
jgi:hypothetical protein